MGRGIFVCLGDVTCLPSPTGFLLYSTVSTDVSISATRLIFGEIHNLLSGVGPGCASVVSGALTDPPAQISPAASLSLGLPPVYIGRL